MAGKAREEALTPNDVVDVFEELLPAQNASYDLGLKLRLSPEKVESISAPASPAGH